MDRLDHVANYLDPSETAVRTTIIDFGLSRLDIQQRTLATHLPTECYDGVGAQWDVYRSMRSVIESGDHINDDPWNEFYPSTNVMWLHYIARRLLHFTKSLRKPMARKGGRPAAKGAAAVQNELIRDRAEAAYAMMCTIEAKLGKTSRGKIELASAGEVMAWGRNKEWVV